jgi:hypothetical protein
MDIEKIKDLPIIKIVAERDVPYVEWDLEMEDDTHAMLVKWGKESASDDDYVNIAIRVGLEEFVASREEEESDEDND